MLCFQMRLYVFCLKGTVIKKNMTSPSRFLLLHVAHLSEFANEVIRTHRRHGFYLFELILSGIPFLRCVRYVYVRFISFKIRQIIIFIRSVCPMRPSDANKCALTFILTYSWIPAINSYLFHCTMFLVNCSSPQSQVFSIHSRIIMPYPIVIFLVRTFESRVCNIIINEL